MLSFLKDHPFAVEAFFESSLVLTYAVPVGYINKLLPEYLEADTFNNDRAFIAVALVQAKRLRPMGFPKFMGSDFFLVGYRVFVRYRNEAGKSLRGLYILGSQTDKYSMAVLGSLFTHYRYTIANISYARKNDVISVSDDKGLNIEVKEHGDNDISLPEGSPFTTWKEARRFAGPLPFTFSYNKQAKEVVIVEGVRENWTPAPVEVLQHNVPFVQQLQLKECVLASAFIVKNIPYHWKKGKIEQWRG
ncbi:MAG: hypothetical protein EOP51_03700 [Sphingobacteriales bacterium]|nr:MAG: hypothetical protein EOP51_03700 [Sphingobacteriales bacterium]